MLRWTPPFDPEETKNYARDWTSEMNEVQDTILTATFTVETPNTGLGVVDTIIDATNKIATAWFCADNLTTLRTKAGSMVIINHKITTNGGRTYVERIGLKIREK